VNAEMSDEEREARIENVYRAIMAARTRESQAREEMYGYWKELVRLVKGRSRDQVERMEREMGLR
jgi:hypothetical protein